MSQSIREQARDAFREAFGEPQYIDVAGGQIYRWVLKREHALHLYLTIDAPEMPDICHIMTSDPSSKAVEPISNLTLRTMEEVHKAIDRIREQWRSPETSVDAPQVGQNDYLKRRSGTMQAPR